MTASTRNVTRAYPPEGEEDTINHTFTAGFQLEPGKIIKKRFKIISLLGRGGFGMVYQAFDRILKKPVALKLFHPEVTRDKINFLRIQREINISQKISDERIVKLFSLEQWKDTYFLIMELIPGKTLQEIVEQRGGFGWADFKNIFIQILEGLKSLHEKNIIHRDLKPSNIIISTENQIKILDFGLSKELADGEKTSSIGSIVGSPRFMSPEQIQGESLDFRSDIYQVGLIAYYSLTGEHPLGSSSSTIEMMLRHLKDKPNRVSNTPVKVPEFMDYLIQRCLAKKKNRRFQTVAELLDFIEQGTISILHRIISPVTRNPIRRVILWLLVIPVAVILYANTIGSNKVDFYSIQENGIQARNKFGRKIWTYDSSPFNVIGYADPKLFQKYKASLQTPQLMDPAFFFLLNNRATEFGPQFSISTYELDNRVVFANSRGIVGKPEPITRHFRLENYNFASIFTLIEDKWSYPGMKHSPALEFYFKHGNGLYPSALTIYYRESFFTYTNPGNIIEVKYLGNPDNPLKYYIFGHNNLMAHSFFFAEIFPGLDPSLMHFIPHLNTHTARKVNNFLVFLPRDLVIQVDSWQDKGEIQFQKTHNGELLILKKDYSLSLRKNNSEPITYYDQKINLESIYFLINKHYQEKIIHKNYSQAYQTLNRCFRYPLENPYLRSILFFFKGDLEIIFGKYRLAKKSLDQARRLHPDNPDAAQRITEILFFNNQAARAIKMIDRENSEIETYWGLSFGKELFKMYMCLYLGKFYEAEVQLSKIHKIRPRHLGILKAIVEIFRGNYKNALKTFEEDPHGYRSFFTVNEFRLFWGRAMMLTGKNLKRARFYFEDIGKFSIYKNHLADMSVSYFLAQAGKKEEAENLAKKTLQVLTRQKKSDFDTNLWFFYDSYIYGKTMEMIGNLDEASKGFKLSLEANPHTDLAKKARKRLKKIMGKKG